MSPYADLDDCTHVAPKGDFKAVKKMSRQEEIRENWKVKEQGCGFKDEYFNGNNYVPVKCGINWICPTCKATLKATLSENLKEAESMLVELDKLLNILTYCLDDDNVKEVNEILENKVEETARQKAEWQKLRDEIKLKLQELK